MRYLGRKSALTQVLRSIGELPPEERGPVGQGANQVRRALEQLIEARDAELGSAELQRRLAEDRIDVTLPGDPPLPVGHLHLISQIRRRMEDIFVGLGFSVLEGPEIEFDYYNFTALNHPPEHPARLPQDTFYLAERVLLRTHTSPMQVRAMELQEPPIYVVVPGRVYRPDTPDATHVPMFHQLEGLAIDEDITLADLQGVLLAFARQMFGEATEVRLRPGLLPVHGAERGGGRVLLPLRGHRPARRRALPHLQGRGLDRDPRLGDGGPERARLRGRERLRPRPRAGLRLRDGDRAHRDARARGARPADAVRERPPPAGAVRGGAMRVPLAWLRSYCDPGSSAAEIADALTMSGDKLERLDSVGVGDPSGFVVGRVLEAGRHPDADRLSVCVVDDGSGEPRTIVCGAPNVAAGQTVAVALPGATMPDGTKLGEAKLRGVRSSGMILAEDEVGIGTDHAGIMVLADDLAPGDAAGRPPADRRRGARARGDAQPPRRDERLRRGARPARRHRRAAGRRPHRRGRRAERAPTPPPTTRPSRSIPRSACASPRACSRT